MHELLRVAVAVGRPQGTGALPPDILRFSLEYPGAPEPGAEADRLGAALGATGFELFP